MFMLKMRATQFFLDVLSWTVPRLKGYLTIAVEGLHRRVLSLNFSSVCIVWAGWKVYFEVG